MGIHVFNNCDSLETINYEVADKLVVWNENRNVSSNMVVEAIQQ